MHMELAGKWNPAFSFWYSTNPAAIQPLVPHGLKLYRKKKHAFWNVRLARMVQMRPLGLPNWCGIDCWLVTYATPVIAQVEASGIIYGLLILGSQVESKHFNRIQNVMPVYRCRPANIRVAINESTLDLKIGNNSGSNSIQVAINRIQYKDHENNFAKYQRLFFASERGFLKFGENDIDTTENPILGPIGEWKFLSELGQKKLRLQLATQVEPSSFHLVFGRRERLCRPKVESKTTHYVETF